MIDVVDEPSAGEKRIFVESRMTVSKRVLSVHSMSSFID